MKIIIANDSPTAMFHIRLAWAKVLQACGHHTLIWNIKEKSAFDAFDEVKPDMVFLQSYNLTNGMIELLRERPEIKIIMRLADWSDFNDNLDLKKYPVIRASEKEKRMMSEIQKLPNKLVCHIHHHEDYIEMTHGKWIQEGYKVIHMMNCADTFSYCNGISDKMFATDVAMIGGYWKYKAEKLDKWILPLCNVHRNLKVRLYGNQSWPTAKYCGNIPEEYAKHALASATVCPSIHEPHATEFGYDVVTRPFNLLANKCFCVSDYVEGLHRMLPDSIEYAKTPEAFTEKIHFYVKNPDKRLKFIEKGYQSVINKHTAFDRIAHLWNHLDLDSTEILKGKEKYVNPDHRS